MDERWWERPAAFVTDYWWIFVIAMILVLSLYFTRSKWFASICTPLPVVISDNIEENQKISPVPVESPTIAETVEPSSTQRENPWLTYNNPEWGLSLKYPSFTNGKQIYLVEEKSQVPLGPEQILLLSDSENANSQQLMSDETLRLILLRQSKDKNSLDEWAISMSSYVGPGKFSVEQTGSCDQLSLQTEKPNPPYSWATSTWIEEKDYFYGISATGLDAEPDEINSIFQSLELEGCAR